MKNLWRRAAALVLAAVMVLQGIPVGTVAAETAEAAMVTNVSADEESATEVTADSVSAAAETSEDEETAVVVTLSDSSDEDAVASGTCGDDLTWVLDSEGTLTISGTGDMEDYTYAGPWYGDGYGQDIYNIVIKTGVTSIGAHAFYECNSLTSVTIPDSVTIIGESAFSGCSSLTSVIIPGSVTTIGAYAFSGCGKLTSMEIPDGVTTIGECAFSGCNSLTSVTIPGSVTTIGQWAFNNCSSLASVTISDGVTTIGKYMFGNCSSLVSVKIPDSVTTIGEKAFFWCSSLTSVEIPDSVTSIGGSAFAYCSSLTSIAIPDSVTTIESTAFGACSSLTSVEIPDSVTTIGEYAFAYCSSLTSVEIPDSVTTIGEYAFYGCNNLSDVYFGGSEEQWSGIEADSSTTFSDPDSVTIHYNSTGSSDDATTVDISACTITLSSSSYTYDGSAKKPTVTVTYNGTNLTKGTDYTVSYSDNTNPGTATVTVTGIGDYTGTLAAEFTITLAKCSVSYINNTMYGLKVVWGKVTGASGYYIYIRNDDGTYDSTPTATVEGGDTTEWTDTRELTGGKDYTYKVAAYYKSSDETIIVGPTGTTKTCKYLKWGVVESVTNTTSGLKVTWTKVTGANGYYIFRKAAGEDDYTQVATISGTSVVSWTDTSSLTSGKNYTYKVSAIFTNSKGQVTKGGALTTKTTKYLTPGKISSLANTSSGIYIKWTKVTGATGYYVYRKASSASSYTLVKTITSVGTVSYSDTAVVNSNNVTYTYYIQPYFKSSVGVITKAAYTTKTIVRLVAPTISSLTNSASKTMTVKWGTKSGVTGYQVQYSANSSFSSGNKTFTLTGASTSSKVISGLTKGKTYYVRIRTYKTVNGVTYYSAWTTKKSVKISK